ncbi:MAG: hypothetical protein ACI4FZ_08880 [Lachnospiraceae bacterium]
MGAVETAKREARSFPGSKPPNNAYEIEREWRGDELWIYYRDPDGGYYYATASGLAFAKKMEEAGERRRRERIEAYQKTKK